MERKLKQNADKKIGAVSAKMIDAANRTTTHTPGPWKVVEGEETGIVRTKRDMVLYVLSANNKAVTMPQLLSWPVKNDEAAIIRANARLIAAAPDLLEVAKGALGYLEALPISHRPDEDWFVPLRAAIAKAEDWEAR